MCLQSVLAGQVRRHLEHDMQRWLDQKPKQPHCFGKIRLNDIRSTHCEWGAQSTALRDSVVPNAPAQPLGSLQSPAPHQRLSSPPACLGGHLPDGGHILVTEEHFSSPANSEDPFPTSLHRPRGTSSSIRHGHQFRTRSARGTVLLCLRWLLGKSS